MAASMSGKLFKLIQAVAPGVTAAILCASAVSAAPLLYGHVNEEIQAPSNTPFQAAAVATAPQQPTMRAAAVAIAPQQPTVQIQKDPLSRFQGTWQSVTVVTDSMVSTVPAGQQVVSTMEFAKSEEGRLHARWQQPGWRESQSAITVISPENFMIDRTSYFFGERTNGSWATRSRDQYNLIGNNQIVAVSEIDQYIDGRYIGRYCTRSILTKISDSASVAFR